MTKEDADENLLLPNMSNFVQKRSAILHFTSEDAQLFLRASVQVRKVFVEYIQYHIQYTIDD